ncbi:MAG: glycyl-radical enzyme activating protein [Bacteroidales bacterium]|nr:glycyl-radical enzyme activating protein [Bacteroidales bacterium]
MTDLLSDKGLIFDIKRFSINDGPGIRTTIFFKGCPLSCWWCHNPEGISGEIEEVFVTDKLDGREFRNKEHVGKYVTVEDLINEIEKERIFHETSKGGVTFSGGEPLIQHEFLLRLADECTLRGIHTCLDTSGYISTGIFRSILNRFDLFLYDIKILDDKKHMLYTGVPSAVIIDNLHILSEAGRKFIIRFPVVPGINDDSENISLMKDLIVNLDNEIRELHLLPYHGSAKSKYKKFGREFKMKNNIKPDENKLNHLKKEFEQTGYKVIIGG